MGKIQGNKFVFSDPDELRRIVNNTPGDTNKSFSFSRVVSGTMSSDVLTSTSRGQIAPVDYNTALEGKSYKEATKPWGFQTRRTTSYEAIDAKMKAAFGRGEPPTIEKLVSVTGENSKDQDLYRVSFGKGGYFDVPAGGLPDGVLKHVNGLKPALTFKVGADGKLEKTAGMQVTHGPSASAQQQTGAGLKEMVMPIKLPYETVLGDKELAAIQVSGSKPQIQNYVGRGLYFPTGGKLAFTDDPSKSENFKIVATQAEHPDLVKLSIDGGDGEEAYFITHEDFDDLVKSAGHPAPQSAPPDNNSPGRGRPDNSTAGELSGALNRKIDPKNPPTITIPEPLKNLGEKIGQGSDDMGAAVQEQLQGRAAHMHAQLEGAIKPGDTPAQMLGNLFKILPGFVGFTRGAAETAGRQVKSAEEGIGAEVRGAKGPLQEAANPLQRLGEQLRRTMSGDGEKSPTEERRYLKPEEGLPWAKQPQQPKAEQPPLPTGRPERGRSEQRSEAPPTPVGRPAAPERHGEAAPPAAAGSPRGTSADGLAMTWKKGDPVEPYDLKVQEMQLALAKIDPKYEKIMTYTNKAGEKVFADGLKAGKTTEAIQAYAKDFGLNPRTLQLADLVKHAQVIASAPKSDGNVQGVDGSPDDRYRIAAIDHAGELQAQFAQAADGPQNMPRSPAPALAVDNSLDKIIQDGQKMQFSSMG